MEQNINMEVNSRSFVAWHQYIHPAGTCSIPRKATRDLLPTIQGRMKVLYTHALPSRLRQTNLESFLFSLYDLNQNLSGITM